MYINVGALDELGVWLVVTHELGRAEPTTSLSLSLYIYI